VRDSGRVTPEPGERADETAVTGHHLPALNGLRALAVFGVVAYHLQLGWASGGYLGVDLFFVLSGFLITSLLLEEWVGAGRIDLVGFWARRAKRLLPALFLVLVALAAYLILNAQLAGPGANGLVDLSDLRGDALATLLYVGNWHSIFAHQSYFAQFSTPSPLQHTWSLAIEEQFYLIWPPVLLLILRGARRSWRRVGLTVAVVGALASAGLMALLFHPGGDPTRVYYGTDTRLFDLMAGVTVAFLAAARPQPGRAARRALHVAGPVAAVALGVFWVIAGTGQGVPKNWMFEGGFLLCAVLGAVVVADARLLERGPFARVLSMPPLHFLGTISYGIYLWHWPIVVYMTGARTGLATAPLDVARVGATLVLATASYYLVERPIRRMKLRGALRLWLAPLVGVATAACLVVATVPAVADPNTVATTSKVAAPTGVPVAGSGGYGEQTPITLPKGTVISPAHPLRVVLLGDSVMHDASYGITAALSATGEGTVQTNTIDGFGLTTATSWPTSIPRIIREEQPQLIIASWSWDQFGPTTPNALHQPAAYTALLKRAVSVMLTPGDGVDGVIFTQFPLSGTIAAANPANQATYNKERLEGLKAWNDIAEKMAAAFPGRVMYLPVASSLLLDGRRYSAWLPPVGDPHAPKDQWTRVRKLDNVHLCPEGSARYAQAILTDLTAIFRLAPASPAWTEGAWTSDPNFNNPPGACPDDHP
jgi:peptidoglycan/LPS O-acetylase OafA/YrhL